MGAPQLGLAGSKQTILIADDSESGRTLLSIILHRAGFQIVEAADGPEVLARARGCLPVLFILDLNMPLLDGYEVALRIRQMPPHATTPLLALSAGVSDTHRERLVQAGFSAFMLKPVAPAELRAQVFRLVQPLA